MPRKRRREKQRTARNHYWMELDTPLHLFGTQICYLAGWVPPVEGIRSEGPNTWDEFLDIWEQVRETALHMHPHQPVFAEAVRLAVIAGEDPDIAAAQFHRDEYAARLRRYYSSAKNAGRADGVTEDEFLEDYMRNQAESDDICLRGRAEYLNRKRETDK